MGFPDEGENDYPNYNDISIPLGTILFQRANFSYDNKEFKERV